MLIIKVIGIIVVFKLVTRLFDIIDMKIEDKKKRKEDDEDD